LDGASLLHNAAHLGSKNCTPLIFTQDYFAFA